MSSDDDVSSDTHTNSSQIEYSPSSARSISEKSESERSDRESSSPKKNRSTRSSSKSSKSRRSSKKTSLKSRRSSKSVPASSTDRVRRGVRMVANLEISLVKRKKKSAKSRNRSASEAPKRSRSRSSSPKYSDEKSIREKKSKKSVKRKGRSKSRAKPKSTKSKSSARSKSESSVKLAKKKRSFSTRSDSEAKSKSSETSKKGRRRSAKGHSKVKSKVRATSRTNSKTKSTSTKRRSRSTNSDSESTKSVSKTKQKKEQKVKSKPKPKSASESSKSVRSASSSKNRGSNKKSKAVSRRNIEDSAKERLKRKAVRRKSFPGRKVTFKSERSEKPKSNTTKKKRSSTSSARSKSSTSRGRSRIRGKIAASRRKSAAPSSIKSKSKRSLENFSKGVLTSSRKLTVSLGSASHSRLSRSKRSRSTPPSVFRRSVPSSMSPAPVTTMLTGTYHALPPPQKPPTISPPDAYVHLSPEQMQELVQTLAMNITLQAAPMIPWNPVTPPMIQGQLKTEQYTPIVAKLPKKEVTSTTKSRDGPISTSQKKTPSRHLKPSVSRSENSVSAKTFCCVHPCSRDTSREMKVIPAKIRNRKPKRVRATNPEPSKVSQTQPKPETSTPSQQGAYQPKTETLTPSTAPQQNLLSSKLRTVPEGKVSVDHPLANPQTIPIVIMNDSPTPFAWTLKTSRPEHFQATPDYGMVDGYGSMYTFVSFKGFAPGEGPLESDGISVMWTDVEKGAGFSMMLFGKEQARIGKKTVQITYNE